jgi:hypothetical protein
VKVKIGGIAGLVAPLLGKQPPDTHVWVLTGDAPAFVKLEGPLYATAHPRTKKKSIGLFKPLAARLVALFLSLVFRFGR